MLNHVASILAGLIDNDNDGCADDPKALSQLLTVHDGFRVAALLPNNENVAEATQQAIEAAKYWIGTVVGLDETKPQCSGLQFTHTCSDASIEEMFHLLIKDGHARAYPATLGAEWTSNSALTRAMDIARYYWHNAD